MTVVGVRVALVLALPLAAAAGSAKAAPRTAGPSYCSSPAAILFSCTLRGSGKVASLCAREDKSAPDGLDAFYAFGRPPHQPELLHRATDAQSAFHRTHLRFAGNAGGYAFSFASGDYRYIVYNISGSGFDNNGLMVQRGKDVLVNAVCDPARTAPDTYNDRVDDLAFKWPKDPIIDDKGLPATPP